MMRNLLILLFIPASVFVTSSWVAFPELPEEARRLLIQLCPELTDVGDRLKEYRYDNETAKCYEASGGSGPCGENMAFFADDDVYGYCACNDIQERLLIYHETTNQCYFIYTQAYCPTGQWLTVNVTTSNPECTMNPCNQDSSQELVYFNNRCVQLYSSQPECEGAETVQLNGDSLDPQCGYAYQYHLVIALKRCVAGRVRSITGSCQHRFNWG